jgi:hypothetical protein
MIEGELVRFSLDQLYSLGKNFVMQVTKNICPRITLIRADKKFSPAKYAKRREKKWVYLRDWVNVGAKRNSPPCLRGVDAASADTLGS